MATTENKTTQKGKLPGEQNKKDAPRVRTVTPDNDNGDPGPVSKDAAKSKHK